MQAKLVIWSVGTLITAALIGYLCLSLSLNAAIDGLGYVLIWLVLLWAVLMMVGNSLLDAPDDGTHEHEDE